MITRPLDLASRLRPPPKSFDALFYVNVAALALFFLLFGSRFVLAPGLGVDFRLPEVKGARAGASSASHYVTVGRAGQIYAPTGRLTLPEFRSWLLQQARAWRAAHPGAASGPTLLVRASAGVTTSEMADISSAASDAGFRVIWAAEEPQGPAEGAGEPGGGGG